MSFSEFSDQSIKLNHELFQFMDQKQSEHEAGHHFLALISRLPCWIFSIQRRGF